MHYCPELMKTLNYLIILFLFDFVSVNKSFAQQFEIINNSVVVSESIDLHGETKKLPNGYTLEIKNGQVKNGTLVGNQTKLLCSDKAFNHVHFKGTWIVPNISTSLFADLSYENALKDVVSLANPNVQNTIIIEEGVYQVAARKNADVCLPIPGNTTLHLNGTINLKPNAYLRCDVIRAKGSNIRISGNGTIVGDKHTHFGTEGEWGMGIRFHGAKNASVRGVTIKDCWGDCVYVGGNSRHVIIENCILDQGRRQGISVTKADDVVIRNCKISNVGGTKPEYAIDLEPNKGDTVDHVVIENVNITNCKGGILATIGKKNIERKSIGEITVRNCSFSVYEKYPIRLRALETAIIEGCTIKTNDKRVAISISTAKKAYVRKNKLEIESTLLGTIGRIGKSLSKSDYTPIQVTECPKQSVIGNLVDKK